MILLVCTGNLCRSPVMEHLLRDRLLPLGNLVRISSAGLRAAPGQPMEPHARRSLRETGVHVEPASTARRLTPELVAAADLVLTADRAQRPLVAGLLAGSWDRIFTLRELARLVDQGPGSAGEPADRIRALVARAALLRRDGGAPGFPDDDVADPMGRRYPAFRSAAERIAEPVGVVASQILGC